VPKPSSEPAASCRWLAPGDANAFVGLSLDNLANLLLTVGLLGAVFAFPTDFALNYMIPGTAIGVLVGDLAFFRLALAYARRTGASAVTAMPLGIDTPSLFGMVFFVLGPAYAAQVAAGATEHDAAMHAWHIGIGCIFLSGVFKIACAFASGWIRRLVPRAGLLGSLAAVAIALISFVPLMDVMAVPLVGIVALFLTLIALTGRFAFPFKIPSAVGALIASGVLYYLLFGLDMALGTKLMPQADPQGWRIAVDALLPTGWFQAFAFGWISALPDVLDYLPIVLPFALMTVIGGIDCAESAAAAGDDFKTETVIGIEGVATLIAALCGGVIQTTPYIGHPAYKAMGGRAGYVLFTALFIGAAGTLGFFGFIYLIVPKSILFPILIFIGLEIASQSFQATPRLHYPALVLACIPAFAKLVTLFTGNVLAAARLSPESLSDPGVREQLFVLTLLGNGFFVTALVWASALACVLDRRIRATAGFFAVAAVCSLFGVMHSPLPTSPIVIPYLPGAFGGAWMMSGDLPLFVRTVPYQFALAYGLVAAAVLLWGGWLRRNDLLTPIPDHVQDAQVAHG
jgi:AGZA family xanthine/uracil permease-like MFS transporter